MTGKKASLEAIQGGENPKRVKFNYSARHIRGRLERFVKRNTSSKKLQAWFNELSAKDKITCLENLYPYILSRPVAGSDQDLHKLTDEQLDQLLLKAELAARKAAGWE